MWGKSPSTYFQELFPPKVQVASEGLRVTFVLVLPLSLDANCHLGTVNCLVCQGGNLLLLQKMEHEFGGIWD